MITEWTTPFVESKDEFIAELGPDHTSYEDLLRLALEIVVRNGGPFGYGQAPDPNRIHRIDDGDYQGTLVFVIGADGYQPSTYWYTKVGYGSCSGCDALEAALYDDAEPNLKALYSLTLHMLQRAKRMED